MKSQHTLMLVCGFLLVTLNVNGQSWPGYETGRFTGTSSANLRPGGMAPIPYKFDATLFGVHLFANPTDVFNKDFGKMTLSGGFMGLAGFSQLHSNRTHVFSNLQGPSFIASINEKVSFAFTWNMRYMWLSDFSEPQITGLFDKEAATLNLDASDESANILYTGWNEFGVGAGGVLWEEGFHTFSIGGFAKFVFGTGLMNLNFSHLDADINGNSVEGMNFSLQGDISDNMYDLVDDGKLDLVGKLGYGFDFGAEYKFLNPRSCPGASNYRLKAGIALTDMGRARYEAVSQIAENNASAADIGLEAFRGPSFRATTDTLQQLFNIQPTTTTGLKTTLPMSTRLYFEVNIKRRAIIYTEFHFVFAQLTNPDMPMLFRYNLTPRFEDDRFGVYLPMTFTNYIPANVGLAIRLKPLIIGSGNLFTFFAYDDRGKALDFYVTIKVPILQEGERIDWKTMMKR